MSRTMAPELWHPNYGSRTMAPELWHLNYGSRTMTPKYDPLCPELWQLNYGTRTMAAELWHLNYGSRTMAPELWQPNYDPQGNPKKPPNPVRRISNPRTCRPYPGIHSK
ncbi:hypothetical protein RhiirA4_432618 [Rhizophagus irregularis]|uniref:Uncharacterized protein n=1 Tax=Rhizophagus irregularis TaxID=588596 RepID=A0A2I1HUL1_9GLOM|nr:hypothetical protein RhiirA4_432618 [Rhizophagus irregularis]